MIRLATALYHRLAQTQESLRMERDNAGDIHRLDGSVRALTEAVADLQIELGAVDERHVKRLHLHLKEHHVARVAAKEAT